MSGIGEFFLKAAEWGYDFWPFRIVLEYEQGLRFYAGTITKTLTSKNGFPGARGLHWFTPGLGEIETLSCNWEVNETSESVSITTLDGVAVDLGATITFRVRDMKLYYVSIHDQDDTVDGTLRAAIAAVGRSMNWGQIQNDEDNALGEAIEEEFRRRVYGWGLEVRDIVPTIAVRTNVLRVLGT